MTDGAIMNMDTKIKKKVIKKKKEYGKKKPHNKQKTKPNRSSSKCFCPNRRFLRNASMCFL